MQIPVRFSAAGKDKTGALDVPVSEVALVLVDMWNWHDPDDDSDPPEYLMNAQHCLDTCRNAGVTVVHAPNWPVTHRYGQHNAIEAEAEPLRDRHDPPEHMQWPPRDSPTRQQASALRDAYALSEDDRKAMMDKRTISRYLLPRDDELVISTHNAFRYALWKRGITLLLYVGGALNECMLHRDTSLNYIVGSDSRRTGFTVVVLEDCVYAMPSDSYTDEEMKLAMLDYYRRKIAFTAVSTDLKI